MLVRAGLRANRIQIVTRLVADAAQNVVMLSTEIIHARKIATLMNVVGTIDNALIVQWDALNLS